MHEKEHQRPRVGGVVAGDGAHPAMARESARESAKRGAGSAAMQRQNGRGGALSRASWISFPRGARFFLGGKTSFPGRKILDSFRFSSLSESRAAVNASGVTWGGVSGGLRADSVSG